MYKPQEIMKPKKLKLQLNKETIANLSHTQMSRINGGNGQDSGTFQYPDDLMFDDVLVGGDIYFVELENGEQINTQEAFTASISTCHISNITCCRTVNGATCCPTILRVANNDATIVA